VRRITSILNGKFNVGEAVMKRINFTSFVLTNAYASAGYTEVKKVCIAVVFNTGCRFTSRVVHHISNEISNSF
jgi:hypothetical protein